MQGMASGTLLVAAFAAVGAAAAYVATRLYRITRPDRSRQTSDG